MNPNERITFAFGKPCIRGIPVFDIYRNLTFGRMTEQELLHQHPGLTPEDILAVREYVVAEITARSHDEITGRPILTKNQLNHGRYYKGRCRNATVARWNAKQQQFYHWRKKFDRIYIQTIKHPRDEMELFSDIFWVVEELSRPRFEIPFDMSAAFTGNPDDLVEFNIEMWHRPKE